jgi:hypothetical protein
MARKYKGSEPKVTKEWLESLSFEEFIKFFSDSADFLICLLERGATAKNLDRLLARYLKESLKTSMFLIHHLKAQAEQGQIDIPFRLSQLAKMREMISRSKTFGESDRHELLALLDEEEKALKEASRVN